MSNESRETEESGTPQITDVTDLYRHENSTDEVSMEDFQDPQETVITFPPEVESLRRAELASMPKEQLIDIIMEREKELRLRARILQRLRRPKLGRRTSSSEAEPDYPDQLSETLPSSSSGTAVPEQHRGKKRKNKNRELDFSLYGKRHVALLFLYLGWDYQGFVVQDDSTNTVEDRIFTALAKTKLIVGRDSAGYHRCGRTDKSVSAFSQVISIQLRSTLTEGLGLITPASATKATSTEIPYTQILNGVLPKNIRMISWCPVEPDFSARFSCRGRKYRYYFPRSGLDLVSMNEAAQLLRGEHDYRNFCKADLNNGVINYVRRIDNIFVDTLDGAENPCEICVLHIYGSAFLWHQVRSIAALLFLIGQRKEEPAIISDLLDINKWPAKPQYTMAEGFPLVLFDCEFENVAWVSDEINLRHNINELQRIWTEHAVKAAMVMDMIRSLNARLRTISKEETDAASILQVVFSDGKAKIHQPLRSRRTCDTIENRMFKKLKVQQKVFPTSADGYVLSQGSLMQSDNL